MSYVCVLGLFVLKSLTCCSDKHKLVFILFEWLLTILSFLSLNEKNFKFHALAEESFSVPTSVSGHAHPGASVHVWGCRTEAGAEERALCSGPLESGRLGALQCCPGFWSPQPPQPMHRKAILNLSFKIQSFSPVAQYVFSFSLYILCIYLDF